MSQRRWREAEALAEAGKAAEAAAIYADLAARAERAGDRQGARRAALLAGDAFRRDDRPAAAARALLTARRLGGAGPMELLNLGAALMDSGEVGAARDLALQAAREAALTGDRALEVLCRDTLAGALLASGAPEEIAAARREVAAVGEAVAAGMAGAEVARRFRAAQIDRLDGLIGRAVAAWQGLAGELAAWEQAAGPRGACLAEIGEAGELRAVLAAGAADQPLAAWLGADPGRGRVIQAALDAQAAAGEAWARAGRRSGALRSEAWRVRLLALDGRSVLPGAVERAIGYAEDRGLPLLQADLLGCLARVDRSPAPALRAIPLLGGAALARGRARVLAAELGAPLDPAAFDELRGDAAWTARAMLRSPDPAVRAEGRARAALLAGG